MKTVMGFSDAVQADLDTKLQELAGHPRVQGRVIDLGGVTSLDPLYAAYTR